MSVFRMILDVVLVFAFFVGPFWLPIFLLFLGLLLIPYYWESVVALFCLELLYQGTPLSEGVLSFLVPVLIVLFFFAFQGLRKVIHERIFRF